MLIKWLGALVLGIPVFVLRDYYQASMVTGSGWWGWGGVSWGL